MKLVRLGLVAGLPFMLATAGYACGGAAGNGFGDGGGGGGSGGTGGSSGDGGIPLGDSSNNHDGISINSDGGGPTDSTSGGEGSVKTVNTVYASTDIALYSLDPMTNAVTPIGVFAGMGDGEYNSITDCAVNAEGQVYVNTESQVFTAALPATPGPTATVMLTAVATIAAASGQYFYALAFAPKGFLGSGETLIGGDNTGTLYAINTTNGALTNLGSFGAVPGGTSGEIFALSGDMVFYTNGKGEATGLATIRECQTGGKSCTKNNDYLAGINMENLQKAYMSGTPAATLLSGIYGATGDGGASATIGPGTGYGEIFGLGAWEGNVYGFTNAYTNGSTKEPPYLISISTSTGVGTVIPETLPFTDDGFSGAGVTTSVTITVPPPPPPPPPK
jgi:hypothetical protein